MSLSHSPTIPTREVYVWFSRVITPARTSRVENWLSSMRPVSRWPPLATTRRLPELTYTEPHTWWSSMMWEPDT
jgi:hypothetical protein